MLYRSVSVTTRYTGLKPGTARINWSKLGFDYVPTAGYAYFDYKDGAWSKLSFTPDPFIKVHVLGNVFHYGQSVFEGTKAFHCKDGQVRAFSDVLNWERLAYSCKRLQIPPVTWDMWHDAVNESIQRNIEFVPPYGSGGALYIRPVVIGNGPRLGLGPSLEYKFMVIVIPVGSYYPTGSLVALDAIIPPDFDRCAPLGIGDVKAAANYAADLDSLMTAKKQGFPVCLYLDPRERKFVTEFNTSNFVAIRGSSYITPNDSRAVLNSVTNRRLAELAEKMLGMTVERRPVPFEQEASTWSEVGAVGTAVVVTPIKSITHGSKVFKFSERPTQLQKIHDLIRAIQVGDEPDHFNWLRKIPEHY